MLLESKVDGGTVRRSTNFTYDYHVGDENCQWQDGSEDDVVNFLDIRHRWTVKISDDTFDGLHSERAN